MKSRLQLYGFFLITCIMLIGYGLSPFYQILSSEFLALVQSAKEECALVGYPEYDKCPQVFED